MLLDNSSLLKSPPTKLLSSRKIKKAAIAIPTTVNERYNQELLFPSTTFPLSFFTPPQLTHWHAGPQVQVPQR
jgi:hypothetical protein